MGSDPTAVDGAVGGVDVDDTFGRLLHETATAARQTAMIRFGIS